MSYQVARVLEMLSFILEDLAERINEGGAKDEAEVQHNLLRRELT